MNQLKINRKKFKTNDIKILKTNDIKINKKNKY